MAFKIDKEFEKFEIGEQKPWHGLVNPLTTNVSLPSTGSPVTTDEALYCIKRGFYTLDENGTPCLKKEGIQAYREVSASLKELRNKK